MTRIAPLTAPYDADLAAALDKWMPPGTEQEPLALFRVLAHHRDLFERMRPLGAGILGHGRLPPRTRELLILRTTARAGAGYEWGVHATAFGRSVAGLTDAQLASTATGGPFDAVWEDPEDRLAIEVADDVYDHDRIRDELWERVTARYDDGLVLEMVICCGWYRLLSTVIRTAGLDAEAWAVPFPIRRGEGGGGDGRRDSART